MCHDVDQDVIHLVAELRISDQTPGHHFAQIRALEKRIFNRHMDFPVAWPADAGTRDNGSGEPVKNLYKHFGLRMMAEAASHAHLKGAEARSLEGGVAEIDARERAGKWKVSRGCVCYLEERRLYHRKDGEIVKLRDDTLSAARYGAMMRRFFKRLDECGGGPIGAPWPSGGQRGGGGPQSPAARAVIRMTAILTRSPADDAATAPGRRCARSVYVGAPIAALRARPRP
jgi:hypothetical protein